MKFTVAQQHYMRIFCTLISLRLIRKCGKFRLKLIYTCK